MTFVETPLNVAAYVDERRADIRNRIKQGATKFAQWGIPEQSMTWHANLEIEDIEPLCT